MGKRVTAFREKDYYLLVKGLLLTAETPASVCFFSRKCVFEDLF